MKLAHLGRGVLATLALAYAVSAAPAVRTGLAQDYDKFVQDFRQAMSVNDGPRMASLVKSNSIEATWHVDRICTAISEQPSEELEVEAQALTRAWRQGRETAFADNYYAFLSLIRPEDRRERMRFKRSFDRTAATFQENVAGEKADPVFEQVAGEMEGLAQAFSALGDQYYAGTCWSIYAACFNEGYRDKKDVDLAKVTFGYDNAIKAFDRVDLKHVTYGEIKQDFERLTAQGWKEVVDNPDAPIPGAPKAADPALAVEVPMSFEALGKIDQFERPNYLADEMYQPWQWLSFGEKDSQSKFYAQKQGPNVIRVGSSELGVDHDRDGKVDVPIKLTGNMTVVECELIDEGPKRKWAFLMTTGIEEDRYQGLGYHMAPQDKFMNMFYIGAGSMVGMLGETPVRVIDENCDGIYGSFPWSWEYLGLTAGHYHWEMDSVVVGKSKRAVPWSEYAQVGEQWYKLEAQQAGTSLKATPAEVETGKLKLSYKGPPVSWLVVRGEGLLENSYFDVMAGGRGGITVPIGAYTLLEGEVSKGKKQLAMKALMLPGAGEMRWVVQAGKTTEIELGGPFGFDFKSARGEEGVTVFGKSVVIVGQRGERYERPWNCVSRPEVSVRKAGAKKGGKPEKMDAVLDMLATDGSGGFRFGQQDAWFPLDTTFPFVGEAFEVQLVEKKNSLFGKIESEWK